MKPTLSKRVGLGLFRLQPMHAGHAGNILRMCMECETVIIGLGSANTFSRSNPLNIDVRIQQVKNVFGNGNRVQVVPFSDLGATDSTNEWIDYILGKLDKLGLPEPTDYYTGSKADALWYINRFWHPELSSLPTIRESSPYTSHDSWFWRKGEQGWTKQYGWKQPARRLHILDRDSNPVPPATELRTYIEMGSDDWKQWVPSVNHELVTENYPDDFKVGVS